MNTKTLISDAGGANCNKSDLVQSIEELIALCKSYTNLYHLELRRSREPGTDAVIVSRAQDRMEGYR